MKLPELKIADIYDCTGNLCIGLSVVGKNIEITKPQANEVIRRCQAYDRLVEALDIANLKLVDGHIIPQKGYRLTISSERILKEASDD